MSEIPKIFVALDTADLDQAKQWAQTVGPITQGLKVGMEFVNAHGPQGIEAIQNTCPEADLFIDLKFHDIPNTVAGAVRTTCERFAPAYLNVHACGGKAMMQAAKDACKPETKLLGVTILTSLSHEELTAIGYQGDDVASSVKRLALLAQESGLNGVVCSPQEIKLIRETCGPQKEKEFETMVPGIRPAGTSIDDQTRIMTPQQATAFGATNIVIGRPITKAEDPAKAAEDIINTMTQEKAA